MGVRVQNLDAFDATVQQWFGVVEKLAEDAAVGLAKVAFKQVLEMSPQFSGDFAANWKVGLNGPSPDFHPNAVIKGTRLVGKGGYSFSGVDAYQRGSPEAIAYANAHAIWPKVKLGDSLFLSNSAAHDEPYAWKIEDGKINFRPVNEGADHVARRAAAFTLNRFGSIGSTQLAALRRMGS